MKPPDIVTPDMRDREVLTKYVATTGTTPLLIAKGAACFAFCLSTDIGSIFVASGVRVCACIHWYDFIEEVARALRLVTCIKVMGIDFTFLKKWKP